MLILLTRGGVLEDVLGLKDVLEDTFWSPWPWHWPRSLKSLALASKPWVLQNCPVLGLRTARFLNHWNFVGKRQKLCKYLFYFAQLEHRLSQAGLPPIEISPMTKMWQKSLLFLQFQFFLSFFVYTGSKQQYWKPGAPGPPKINLCQPI